MFAYVKYVDNGCKEIVPTTDIKDFDIKLVSSDKFYWVRWKEAFYKAQIIFIKGELSYNLFDTDTVVLRYVSCS